MGGPGRSVPRHLYWCALLAALLLLASNPASCRAGTCRPESRLEEREEAANVVLTGTVEEILNMDPVHNTYSCKVRVWRYLKGKSVVNGELLLEGGNKVMIGGFGDPGICDNEVATGDTRIFFLNPGPERTWPGHRKELMLNSSLMRITLRNLEDVEHCVQGRRGVLVLPPQSTRCRGMLCGFGAVCERDPVDSSKGMCVCKKTTCPSVVAPVCGSDSSTYSNECELEKAQCSLQRRIKVVRKGPCGLKDPCSEVTCSYGSTCVQSSDGQSAKCMCPLSCEGQREQVVCGSDGKDYPSECELNKQACASQKNIRKQHAGPCDPCKNNQTHAHKACRVEPRTRRPQTFPLPKSCPPDAVPLCASDGQTYDSGCSMQLTGQLKGIVLRKVHSGQCEDCKEECKFNAVCLLDRLGPHCSCEPIRCDGSFKPLCGKDGRTYSNDCERRQAECLAKVHIPVKQQGPCDLHMPSPCLQISCAFGAVCVVKDGGAVCECPGACPPPQEPVCGSDGHTYGSQCQMKAVACSLQKDIHMKHRGPCTKACQNCSFGAICDGQTGRCVCPTECVDTNQPVCGSDGLTYSSECELHVRACTRQLDLKVAAQRDCGGVACGWGARCVRNRCECPTCHGEPFGPVCGSNGVTYDNACELQVASCNLKKNIKVARAGGCDEECGSGASGSGMDGSCEQDRCRIFGGSWDEDAEEDRCVCDFSCHTVPHIQVCGTDGVTYSSECELKKTRCEKQQHLQVYSQGPCLGETPTVTLCCHCSQTVYGCCLDNTTAALGVELAGCPSTCQCNPYGSYGGLCDPTTGQCSCKPGVGGLKCDRCEPGFWNFRGIVTENMSGCTPCHCDALGSVRDDCEQMSGLCSCKTGVKGMKCDVCPDGSQMGTNGCEHGRVPSTDMDCKFGASCVEAGGQAHCECPSPDCAEKDKTKVCGSDGVTYADACQLNTIACRQDKLITVKHKGQCSGEVSRSRGLVNSCPLLHLHSPVTAVTLQLIPLPATNITTVVCGTHRATMKFSGFLHLDQVEGQELFYTPEMEDPKSELFGETARSIESALNELYRKSSVQKDFKSVRVRNLAPSSSILAFVEVHLDPDTRFTVEDVEQALLKVLRTTKATAIVVRKPVEENIRFSLSTLPFFTTTATTTTISPTTRRPTTSRRTTTPSPVATATATASLFHYATTPFRPKLMPKVMKPPQPSQPCKSHPCQHGGTCEDDGHDFTCICPAGRGGVVCEKVIKYFIPAFGGKSYLAFPTMKAYHTVRIAMEFRTFETTGLLLFNGQNGKKDFLSLALLSGHVQLRFNTGSGTGTLVSRVRVRLGRWHQLVVTRNRRNAMLSVDSEPYIEGESPPGTDGLNLDTDLFVGGVPEELLVKERTSVASGLVGCIRTLDVNNMVYSLQENGGYVLYGSAVGECGNNPCEPNPCHNGATCQVKEAEMFHCKCVNGFSGPTCADAHNPCDPNRCHPSSQCKVLPAGGYKCECPMGRAPSDASMIRRDDLVFPAHLHAEKRGTSYLQYYYFFVSVLRHKVSMTVVFLAEDPNGMIFYNGQRTDGRGDFISLALNDGILEFRYDLGKGPAVIRSRGQIPMNTWNTVNLERAGRKGELSINDKDRVRGEAPYQHAALNLKESFFVGGVPDFSKVARAASLSSGFRGAIQKITLMGTPVLTRENALRSRDVSMYKHHRCAHGVCQNGGLCNPLQASYECICQHGFGGSHCQDAIIEKSAGEAESIAFDGHTFIEYHNAVTKSEKALLVNRFELSIRTEATHGLILWSGKGTERSDYIALAVVDGRVQMTYDLGSKPVVLQSSVRVDTNRWIRIKASRTLRDGSLQVGNEAAVTGSSPLAATQLDTDGALWLGGLEELALARRLPKAYSTGFVGCVKDVSVDGVELHLIEDALNNPRILHCSAK
uniref:Agrin n=1 Tax=Scleropages formosus TaxID=113540 RepID=A0A8D0CD03_SCLFO